MRISLAIAVTFAIATVIGAVAVVAADAQEAAGPRPTEGETLVKLKAADANKDGKWDRPEWLAAGRRDRGFDFIDADQDGFVTPDEIKSGMDRMRAQRGTR